MRNVVFSNDLQNIHFHLYFTETEQLYFDQKREWVFTNKPIRFVSPTKIMTANAYDSDKDVNVYGLSEITGIVNLD